MNKILVNSLATLALFGLFSCGGKKNPGNNDNATSTNDEATETAAQTSKQEQFSFDKNRYTITYPSELYEIDDTYEPLILLREKNWGEHDIRVMPWSTGDFKVGRENMAKTAADDPLFEQKDTTILGYPATMFNTKDDFGSERVLIIYVEFGKELEDGTAGLHLDIEHYTDANMELIMNIINSITAKGIIPRPDE